MNLPHSATIEARSGDIELAFSSGTVAFPIGAVIIGGTSEATATVAAVVLETGTWSGHDAAGTLTLVDVDGTFLGGDALTGTPAGSATAGAGVLTTGALGTPSRSWLTLRTVRCRFYAKTPYPAPVTVSGESVRKIPMVMLETAVIPHEQRIVSTVEGYEGTFTLRPKPCGSSRAKPHHYEYELEAVPA